MRYLFRLVATVVLSGVPVVASAFGPNPVSNALNTYRSTVHADNAPLPTYASEQAAHRHCSHDTIVWLDTTSGIWYVHGDALYGKKRGAYVCEQEAAVAHKHHAGRSR